MPHRNTSTVAYVFLMTLPLHPLAQRDGGLDNAIDAVLRQEFTGIDTSALMQTLRHRAQWGESSARFVEAEAILHASQGQWGQALPLLKRLPQPSALALSLMAEGMEGKGEIYEAAAYHLRAARAYPKPHAARLDHFRRYLSVFPEQAEVRMEWAEALAATGQEQQAAEIFGRIGLVKARAGDLKGAAKPLQRALDLGNAQEEVLIQRARAYHADGDKDMANSILGFILEQNPESVAALACSNEFAHMAGTASDASTRMASP